MIKPIAHKELNTVFHQPIELDEFVPKFVNIEHLDTKVLFGVAERLVFNAVLYHTFIDEHVEGNFPRCTT